jgi:hypothetical protein
LEGLVKDLTELMEQMRERFDAAGVVELRLRFPPSEAMDIGGFATSEAHDQAIAEVATILQVICLKHVGDAETHDEAVVMTDEALMIITAALRVLATKLEGRPFVTGECGDPTCLGAHTMPTLAAGSANRTVGRMVGVLAVESLTDALSELLDNMVAEDPSLADAIDEIGEIAEAEEALDAMPVAGEA